MQWLAENWLVLLLFTGMLAMHLFGHGHGSHGGRGTSRRNSADRSADRPDRVIGSDDEAT